MIESRIGQAQVAFKKNAVHISSSGFQSIISDVNVSYQQALARIRRLDSKQIEVVKKGLECRMESEIPPIGFEEVIVNKVLKDIGQ